MTEGGEDDMRRPMTALLFTLVACGPKKDPASMPTTTSLADTVWTLDAELEDEDLQHYEVTLNADGSLGIHSGRDTSPENDFWSLEGGVLTLTMNDSYVAYTGRFLSPERVEGSATNVKAETWAFTLSR